MPFVIFVLTLLISILFVTAPQISKDGKSVCVMVDASLPFEDQDHDIWACAPVERLTRRSQINQQTTDK